MFNWLVSRKSADNYKAAVDFTFECLILQSAFVEKRKFLIFREDGKLNRKAAGYAFGFLDAVLQRQGMDIRDSNGEPAFLSLLARLFPTEVGRLGTVLITLKTEMESDSEILNGVMLGGTQAVGFFKDSNAMPVRWATCFSDELDRALEKRDAETRK